MKIPDSVLPFLRVQAGYVPADLTREAFEAAYWASTQARMFNIKPFLPEKCDRVIDIGGGMCGIGMLLIDHYGPELEVVVVDGLDGDPEVIEHARPFSSAFALSEFYRANGYRPPFTIPPGSKHFGRPVGLVLSFAAWGFHIAPSEYLDQVVSAKAGPVIIDVRRHKPEWSQELRDGLGEFNAMINMNRKYMRLVWT